MRRVEEGKLDVARETGLEDSGDPAIEAARQAIYKNIQDSCNATLAEALDIQAKHSAAFMVSSFCKKGVIGAEFTKTMKV